MLPRLWLCADLSHPAFGPGGPWVEHLAHAQRLAPVTLWLRPTATTPARQLLEFARVAKGALSDVSVLLVGDRVDVALAAGAHGVHLPERALEVGDVRALASGVGRSLCVSAAVHDLEGVSRRLGADALVASPFEPVAGKGPALGERGLRALRERAPGAFLVALGGLLDESSCARALAAGADAVALRRLWLDAPLPEALAAVVTAR